MVIAAQALSYKLGQLTIIRLRKEAEEALGANFDIKEFHHVILEGGDMPLSALEIKVKAWVEKTK